MKKINLITTILVLLVSCNPLYKKYKDLTLSNSKKTFRYKKISPTVKRILRHYNDDKKILVISWENNVFDIKKKVFNAIIYDFASKKTEFIYNIRTNQNNLIFSNSKPSEDFYDELFILKNYLDGNEKYLQSLHDSFSNSDIGSNFYLYDFQKNKKIEISAIGFDEKGKLIQ